MAVHAGTFFFDNRPMQDAASVLTAGLAPLTPYAVTLHDENGVAMAHGAQFVWSGERSCRQPLLSAAGLMMTWDGRLDNRGQLLRRLGQHDSPERADADVALLVFERWGPDGLRWLIGDWSLALWHRTERTVYLARDYIGVRPFYYALDDRALMWSSDLGELAQRAGRADALDDRFITGFMTARFSTDVTPYRGIRAVPPACVVSVNASGREDRHRFWTLEPGTIRYRDRRTYEDHLRDLWAESVGARLRVESGDVWAELSGGLDSSSVVCMADSLIKSRVVGARRVRPMSHVTLSSPEGDERRFIAEVEARTGRSSDILGIEEHEGDRDGVSDWVSPCASRGIGLAALRHVRARGGQVVLSGRLGDLVMGCDPDNSVAVFDRLADVGPLSALAELRRWSRATRKPFVELLRSLVIEGIDLLNAGEAFREPALTESQCDSQALLSEQSRNLWPEQERDHRIYSNVPLSKRRLALLFVGYPVEGLFAIPMLPHDITYAYPFAHRPLVEFMFAIPGEELSAPGETRSLMRRAFRGLVPDRILRRTSKGYYPPGATRAARSAAPALLPVDQLEVVRRGWFNPERLTAAVRTLLDGSGHSGGDVRRVLILEEWLASRHRRGPAAIPQRKEVTSHEVLNT